MDLAYWGLKLPFQRDYPIVLGALYFFTLLGLLLGILSDLAYTWIDPRIDFEKREI